MLMKIFCKEALMIIVVDIWLNSLSKISIKNGGISCSKCSLCTRSYQHIFSKNFPTKWQETWDRGRASIWMKTSIWMKLSKGQNKCLLVVRQKLLEELKHLKSSNIKKMFHKYPVCRISGRIFGNRISGFLISGIRPDTG